MIYLDNRTRGAGLDAPAAARTLARLLGEIGESGTSASLTFVRDAEMRRLNAEHRAKDAPTDVLSFPMFDPDAFDRSGTTRPAAAGAAPGVERMLGDIVISVDTAQRQAEAYDAPLGQEISRLLIHGVLHLAGHDHLVDEERAVMEREERRLAAAIGMPWPYADAVSE